ncbi:MAG: undecaprenyl-diphosphate phosphatase [Gammaproteobacteria bacterium]|nr:undecaprenyl-diphosphate phosphatase [Gammaproteobacteria bacterium]
MDNTQIVFLAIVQGLTEFLPISSSAHLILVPLILQWPDQGLVFDVAVHLGSLIAVLVYFRTEVVAMTIAWSRNVTGAASSENSRLAWWVILGTIPAVVAGYLFKHSVETELRTAWVIAIATIVFALLLGIADLKKSKQRSEFQLNWHDVLMIGCFQALALIPGTSRSGITMTAGLLLGLSRQAAARFSFLLSIPIIFASGTLQTLELLQASPAIDWLALMLALVLSAVSAGICIHLFLGLIEKIGMLPFVIYRLLLGFVLIAFLI